MRAQAVIFHNACEGVAIGRLFNKAVGQGKQDDGQKACQGKGLDDPLLDHLEIDGHCRYDRYDNGHVTPQLFPGILVLFCNPYPGLRKHFPIDPCKGQQPK
jgi:hypothetical protein